MSRTNMGVKIECGQEIPITNLRCRNCFFFKRNGIYTKPNDNIPIPCIELGIKGVDKPCLKFYPNYKKLSFIDNKDLIKLLDLVSKLKSLDLPLISALLSKEKQTRNNGFYLGQKVYIKIKQNNYLSNYSKARIIIADNKYAYLQGVKGYYGMVYKESVYTIKQFKIIRKELQKQNKLIDPNYKKYFKLSLTAKQLINESYEPPSIDQFEEKLNKEYKRKNKNNNIFSIKLNKVKE